MSSCPFSSPFPRPEARGGDGILSCILPRVPSAVSPWKGLSRALFSGHSDLAEAEVWRDGNTGWVQEDLVL